MIPCARITLMGNGAGSESVIYQLLSPANQNTSDIYSIIAQSGSPLGDPMLKMNRPKESAIKLAGKLGCKTDVGHQITHKQESIEFTQSFVRRMK